MKLFQIISRIHQEASGPTYSVIRLCSLLAAQNNEVELHVTHSAGQNPSDFKIHAHGSHSWTGDMLLSPSLKRAIISRSESMDIVHNHGLWMMPNIYPRLVSRMCTLVCSPRGTMSDWAWNRSYWKKRISWAVGQKKMLDRVDCFHATADHEYEDIRKRGFNQPVAIIPNGIDMPTLQPIGTVKNKEKRLLFLARIHPVKGIENLLAAWKILGPITRGWKLTIAGDGDREYCQKLRHSVRASGLEGIEFVGAVFGDDKSRLYTSSDLYVLPSYTENFGVTVAEALAHRIPVITTNATPWSDLPKRNCGWCINVGIEGLVVSLTEALGCDSGRLQSMGARGAEWMEQSYSWEGIGQKMNSVYQWLRGVAPQPNCVRTD